MIIMPFWIFYQRKSTNVCKQRLRNIFSVTFQVGTSIFLSVSHNRTDCFPKGFDSVDFISKKYDLFIFFSAIIVIVFFFFYTTVLKR